MNLDKARAASACILCALLIQGCAVPMMAGTATSAMIAQDRRTPGTFIDDFLIEFTVRSEMRQDANLWKQVHVNVTSFNGLVLLTGEAPDRSLRDRIVDMTRNTPEVRGVQNEIALAAPSALMSRSNDTWVTTKVKAALLRDKKTSAAHVKVVTEQGVVYLMGLVKRSEVEPITEIARRVNGVQRVVKVMEYIE